MSVYDLAVVGAGVGGYVAAIRAAQLGLSVVVLEQEPVLGGTCLNWGCIPTKALLQSSEHYAHARSRLAEHGVLVDSVRLDLTALLARKTAVVSQLTGGVAQLFKKNRIPVIRGKATLVSAGRLRSQPTEGESQSIEARRILLATGSLPQALPTLPFDGVHIVSSFEALSFPLVPAHLIVIGAGAVGLELGCVWQRLGARVTVVEMLPRILPFADRQIAQVLQRLLKQQGLDLRLQTQVTAARVEGGQVALDLQGPKGTVETLVGDRVLVAVGRRPNSADLPAAGIVLDERGRVVVDEHWRTNLEGVHAVGDLVRGPMLAHKAAEEGAAVAEQLAGLPGHVNDKTIPNVVYTQPELASVGLSEEQAKEHGLTVKVGRFLFRANGRALSLGEPEGMAKIVADAQSDRILGVHIVGPQASELIAEATLAMEFAASAEDLARTMHAHPTLSEVLHEAALDVAGRAIHA